MKRRIVSLALALMMLPTTNISPALQVVAKQVNDIVITETVSKDTTTENKSEIEITRESEGTEDQTEIASGSCGESLTWSLAEDGVLTISGEGDMEDYEWDPQPWADYREYITSVVIEDGVTSIGRRTFDHCSSMTSVSISDSVTSIGDCAFYYCRSLTNITIPDSVVSIDDRFDGCRSLTSINVSEGNKSYSSIDGVLYDKDKTTLFICPQGKKGEYIIHDGVQTIGDGAFYYCGGLTNITIPDSVTSIGSIAFYYCYRLTSMELPDRLISIGESAFSDCSSLTNIIIPDSVTNIGDSAFYCCSSLTSINVSDSNNSYSSIDGVLYDKDKTTLIKYPERKEGEFIIPEGVTNIGDNAFYRCTGLTSISIPEGVTTIGKNEFRNCSSLTNITISDSVTDIGGYAFDNCTSLTDVYYSGTEEQWGKISIASGNDSLTSANIHYLGAEPTPKPEDTVEPTEPVETEVLIGDVNGDGIIDARDATVLQRFTVDLQDECFNDYAADIDSNGVINARDIIYLARYCTGFNDGYIDSSLYTYIEPDDPSKSPAIIIDTPPVVVPREDSVTIPVYAVMNEGVANLTFYIEYDKNVLELASVEGDFGYNIVYNQDYSESEARIVMYSQDNISGDGVLCYLNFNVIEDGLSHVDHVDINVVQAGNIDNEALYGIAEPIFIEAPTEAPTETPTVAPPTSGNCGEKLTWSLTEDGVLTISGEGDMDDYEWGSRPWTYYLNDITSVVIEDGVTSIGGMAFDYCRSLTNITIPDSVTSIGNYAFRSCSGLTSVGIPDSVTSIGYMAFFLCSSLTNISIPDSVISIGEWAFYGCSSLMDVYYSGTEEQWGNISIASGNDSLTSANIHYLGAEPTPTPVISESVTLAAESSVIMVGEQTKITAAVSPEGTTDKSIKWTSSSDDIACVNDGVVTGVSAGKIRITATMLDSGVSAFCDIRVVDEAPPLAPHNVLAEDGERSAVISWSYAPEAIADGYKLYRSESSDSGYELIAEITSRDTVSYTDKELEAGKTYYYKVSTLDEYGRESRLSEAAGVLVSEDTTVPYITSITPANYTYITGVAKITVKAEDNTGVEAITLRYSVDNGETWTDYETKETTALAVFDFDSSISENIMISAVASDRYGNVSDGTPVRIYYADNMPPQKVSGLRLKNAEASIITLEWDDVPDDDFSYFIVEEKTETGYKEIMRVYTELGCNIPGKTPETKYTYRVCAVDARGNRGEYSDELIVETAKDTTAPIIRSIKPQAFRTNTDIPLTVLAEDDDGIAKIDIEVSFDLNDWTKAETIKTGGTSSVIGSCTLDISEFEDGYIYVRAVAFDNSGNESDTRNNSYYVGYYIDREPPAAPSNVVVEKQDGYINISWDSNHEDDVTSYNVYRRELDGDFQRIATGLKSINYIDSNIEPERTYVYAVSAVDSAGNESAKTAELEITTDSDSQPPVIYAVTPASGSVINGSSTIKIYVSDNNLLERVTVEYYDGTAWKSVLDKAMTTSGGTVSFTLGNYAVSDGDIKIRAAAIDRSGNSSGYTEVEYIVDNIAPEVYNQKAESSGENIILTWDSANESDLSGYKIYVSKNRGSKSFIGSVSNNGGSTYSFTHYNVTGGAVYVYSIEAYDVCGNCAVFDTEAVTAEIINKIVPSMEIPNTMCTGEEQYFDASSTTATAGVSEYLWDFGDGTSARGAKPAHAYNSAGDYTVTLTVTDNAGSSETITNTVTVKDRQYLGTVKVKVIDDMGSVLQNASVIFNFGSDETESAKTNSSGYTEFKAVPGEYSVAAYKTGYLPQQETVKVFANNTSEITVRLTEEEIVTGYMTSRRLTLDEIKSLGIDLTQPENHNIYECEISIDFGEMEYNGTIISKPNDTPVRIDVPDTNNTYYAQVIRVPSGGSGGSGDSGSEDYNEDEQLLVGIVKIPTQVSWLKEMFAVDLYIINNASSEFRLVDCRASINLPDGLRILETNASSGTRIEEMGTIVGGETGHAAWYIAGDKEGHYDVSADFTAVLEGFNQEVNAQFILEDGIDVYGSKYMKVLVEAEDRLVYGDDYTIRIGLENDGPVSAYLPNIGISSRQFTLNNMYKTIGEEDLSDTNYEELKTGEILWKEYTAGYQTVSESILNLIPESALSEYEGGVLFTNDDIVKYVESIVGNADGIEIESRLIEAREINEYSIDVQCLDEYGELYSGSKLTAQANDMPYTFEVTATRKVAVNGEYTTVPAANTPIYCSMPYMSDGYKEIVTLTDDEGKALITPDVIPESFTKSDTSISIRGNRTSKVTYPVEVEGVVTSGALYGKLTDGEGNPVSGVKVTVDVGNGLFNPSAETDINGDYLIYNITSGTYMATFTKSGYYSMRCSVTITKERNLKNMQVYEKNGPLSIIGVESMFSSIGDNKSVYLPSAVSTEVTLDIFAVSPEDDPIIEYGLEILEGETVVKTKSSDSSRMTLSLGDLTTERKARVYAKAESGNVSQKDVNIVKIPLDSKMFILLDPQIDIQNAKYIISGAQFTSASIDMSIRNIIENLAGVGKDLNSISETINKLFEAKEVNMPDDVITEESVNVYKNSGIVVKNTDSADAKTNAAFTYSYTGAWEVSVGGVGTLSSSNAITNDKTNKLSFGSVEYKTTSTTKDSAGVNGGFSYKRQYLNGKDTWTTRYKVVLDGNVSYNASWTIVTGTVINGYVSAGITLGAGLSLSKSFVDDVPVDTNELESELYVYANLKGSGGVALIHKNLLSGGFYVKSDNKLYVLPRAKVEMDVKVGTEATLLFFGLEFDPITNVHKTLYLDSGSNATSMFELAELAYDDETVYSPLERTQMRWTDGGIRLMSAEESATIAENVFRGSQNSLGMLNGKPTLVFVEDDSSRSSSDRARLVMSVYENGAFTEPAAVIDDGTGDYQPVLASDDSISAVVWTDTSEKLEDMSSMTMEEIQDAVLSKQQISAVIYDAAAGVFGEKSVISETGYLNHTPSAVAYNGKIYAAWLTNKNNVLSNDEGAGDSVMFAYFDGTAWSGPQTVYDAGTTLNNVSIIAGEGGVTVSFSEMKNGINKLYISDYADGGWTTPSKVYDNYYNDYAQQATVIGGERYIIFANETNIFSFDLDTRGKASKIINNAGGNISELCISAQDGNAALAYKTDASAESETINGVYVSYYNGSEWGMPVDISENISDTVNADISCIMNGNELIAVYNSDIYSDNEEGTEYGYERTDIKKMVMPTGSNLKITGVDINSGVPVPGMEAELEVDIKNTGTEQSETYSVELYLDEISDAGFIASHSSSKGLQGNADSKLYFNWTVPDDYQNHKLYVKLSSGDIYEYIPPMSNLSLGVFSELASGTGLTVINSGYNDISDVTLSVYDENDNFITDINAGAIARGEEKTVTVDLEGWTDVGGDEFIFRVSANSPEFDLTDNVSSYIVASETIMKGDATGDGVVDPRDATAILKHSVGVDKLSGEYFTAADVNCDGVIDPKDAVEILKYCVGLTSEYISADMQGYDVKLTSAEDTDAVISVDSTEIAAGENICIPVYADVANGFANFTMDINYDPSVLEIVSVDQGEMLNGLFSGNIKLDESTIRIVFASAENIEGSGALFYLNFKSKAEPGLSTEIVPVVKMLGNSEYSLLNTKVNEGQVIISGQSETSLEIELSFDEDVSKISAKIYNVSDSNVDDADIYFAVYDAEGKLIELGSMPFSINTGEQDITEEYTVKSETYSRLAVFIWDQNMRPLAQEISIQ